MINKKTLTIEELRAYQKTNREFKAFEEDNKMTFEEFKETYQKTKHWDFSKFEIKCVKCGSVKVEFNSDMKLDEGYYGDYSVEGEIIIKCHTCGNAHTINFYDLED